MTTTIYHVTRAWDGCDLRSLAQQVDDGDLGLDAALDLIASWWTDGDLRAADRYLDGDGREVHCHDSLDAAAEYLAEWCDGGVIMEIDADGLDVVIGAEYPHPVVRDRIPAGRVRVLTEQEVA